MYQVDEHGVLKQVETWHVVLPLHDNNKNPFSREVIDSIVGRIADSFPGLSVVSTSGRWKEAGIMYSDDSLTVIIDALPIDRVSSQRFFETLKHQLVEELRQQKIYVTLTATRSELITIDEFLTEMGVEVDAMVSDRVALAKNLAGHVDIVRVRAAYETTLLRRLDGRRQIQWERRFCGVKVVSLFDDPYPAHTRLLAADRVSDFTPFWEGRLAEAYAVIGDHEFQRHLVRGDSLTALVSVALPADVTDTFISPAGGSITARRFVEEFTGAIVVGYIALREEGFLTHEIAISVGRDGSLQIGERADGKGKVVLVSPASIQNPSIQEEIIRCVGVGCADYESGTSNQLALAQAKAMHRSVMKRAAARHAYSRGDIRKP